MPRSAAAALAVLFAAVAQAAAAAPGVPSPGDYLRHPVFYERFPETSAAVGDELDHLRRGHVRLQHYRPADVSRYAWERDSFTEYTWWMQTQELRFLLPAIASNESGDRRLAREWFMRWYAVHMVPEPATATWGEPMSVAYRAMVLVYLLKTEDAREDRDEAVLECIRSTILEHQRHLAEPENADDRTNHGFIDALGLFETTRVFADARLAALAVDRLQGMMDRAVSQAGVEREHSAAYHFVVMQWLEQMAAYIGSLPSGDPEFAERAAACVERMRRAGYFLQDHAGVVPAIGDTDSVDVTSFATGFRIVDAVERTLFDPASGYAVYKGSPANGDCRYLVFRIPGGAVEMRSHCHADALAVLFSHAGETILGDAGRYSYTAGPVREYCVSPSAHSTLMPYPIGSGWYRPDALRLVRDATSRSDGEVSTWSASMTVGGATCRRTVHIPAGANTFTVVDSITPIREHSPPPDEVVMLWNLGGDVTGVEGAPEGREHAWLLTTRRGQQVRLMVSAAGPGNAGVVEARVVRGQETPRLGWYSPAQGVLRPAATLMLRLRRAPGLIVTTRVEVSGGACAPASSAP